MTFTPADALTTTATFPRDGIYVLGLTASDGSLQTTDEVTVLVNCVDLVPIADSEVSRASPDTSWPNNDFRLRVWKKGGTDEEEAFIKFDLSSVPGEVAGSILRLSINDRGPLSGGDLTCDIQGVGDGWLEGLGGITWNNSRSLTGTVLASFWADNPLWTEFDVGAFVTGEHVSDQTASFRIFHRNTHSTSGSRINSREKNVKPTLRVTYNRPPTVTVDSPLDSAVFAESANISFSCTADDPDGGALTYSWASDVAGVIGTTDSFTRNDLARGSHTIAATVTDVGGAQAQDSVTISVGNPEITVIAPNGGESYTGGQHVTITWSSVFFTGNVKIEFYDGISWQTVDATTPDDGDRLWTVPSSAAANCRIRVSDAADGDPTDESDGDFAIFTTGILVQPTVLDLHALAGSVSACSATFTILYSAPSGSLAAAVTAASPPARMTIEPLSLNLTAGVPETVTVSMDLTGLPDDTSIQEQVAVTISAPGAPNSPVSVEVNVDVEPSHVTTGCAAGGSSSATLAAFMVAGLMLGLLRLATRCAAGDAVRQAHNGPILSLPKGGVAPAQAAAVRSAETPEASCAVRPSRRRSPAARPYRLAVGP